MIRRFGAILWLGIFAAPVDAADAEPLPKLVVNAWAKQKLSATWMGTAKSTGALYLFFDRNGFEPGSYIPAFEGSLAGSPNLLDKVIPPLQLFGLSLYISKPGELEQLKQFKTLTRLSLHQAPLGEEGIQILSEMPQLEELRLSACKISPEGLKTLTKLKNLKRLGLRSSGITDAEIPTLKAFEKLEHLELGENLSVTDKGAPAIAELKTLKYLDIYLTRVLDEGLKSIAKMDHLRGLYMMNTKATGAGLKTLGALKDLERFHMDGYAVNAETIPAVLGMKKLRYLMLDIPHPDKTAAGDAEFKKLEAMKDLQQLSVFSWQITDASLPVIRGFEKLEFIELRYTNIKKASAEQLQKDRPKCRIVLP